MKLVVSLPTRVALERDVSKVIAEGLDGVFCLLPRHIDFVSAIIPGILTFGTPGGGEEYLAVDEGILVKCGDIVNVSTRTAVHSTRLEELKSVLEESFKKIEERERSVRSAVAKLEADMVRRFFEMGKYGG